jgi:serine/threonine protein kinase
LVIADFGFTLRVPYTDRSNFGGIADVSEGSVRRLITTQGRHGNNLLYLAPELLIPGMPFDGFAIDMFAAGIILFILLVGRAPFNATKRGDGNYVTVAQRGQLSALLQSLNIELCDDAIDLIQNLLWEDPRRRLTLQETLAHPWLNQEAELKSQPSSDDETETSKSTPFTVSPSSECKDMNYGVVKLTEDSLGRLSLGRMASF